MQIDAVAEKLSMKMPTLKYFGYAIGGGMAGVSEFQSGSNFGDGSYVSLPYSRGPVTLFIKWEKGKIVAKGCWSQGNASDMSCKDFFPGCPAAEFVQAGTREYWSSSCDLN